MRARLRTAAHFCEVLVLKVRIVPIGADLSLRILLVIRHGSLAMHKRWAAATPTNVGPSRLPYGDTGVAPRQNYLPQTTKTSVQILHK